MVNIDNKYEYYLIKYFVIINLDYKDQKCA